MPSKARARTSIPSLLFPPRLARRLLARPVLAAPLLMGGLLLGPACDPSPPPVGTGGGVGTGGTSGIGGAGAQPGTGGTLASGGAVGTGGATTSGGATSTGGGGGATGGQSATGGAGGGSGGAGLTLVEPIERSAGSFVLEFGDYLFEVDPTRGARIVTFSLAGTNLLSPTMLTTGDPVVLNGGSTFWLSPQASWNDWPPVPEIDEDPYEATVAGSTIQVVSAGATVGSAMVHIEKSFSADLAAEAVDIVYEIHNDGAAPATFAPWEISRLARGGMTFWPGGPPPDAGARFDFQPTLVNGVYFWDDSASSAVDDKVSSDGEQGWVAHVDGDLIFVKSWTPVAAADIALNHGEVELYLGDGFIEMEVQGPEGEIAAAGTSTFAVRWYVRPVPVGTDVSVGSADLLALVDAILP